MELHTTESEQELAAQAAQLTLMELSPRSKANQLSVSNYLATMTSCEDNPGASRCPTSKECGELIKKLKYENWDLKCRYAVDRVAGRAGANGTTLSAANIQELAREIQFLKDGREMAERKARDLETQVKGLQETITTGQEREILLQQRNEELIHKLDVLDHELELANVRNHDECLLDKSLMNLHIQDDGQESGGSCLIPETDHRHDEEKERQQLVINGLETEVQQLKEMLDIATEEVTTKTRLIDSLEAVLRDKNELIESLNIELAKYKEKIINMTQALKDLGYRHSDELLQHNNLKTRYKELLEEYEAVRAALEQMKQDFDNLAATKREQRGDDISPDLGIESGIEMSRMDNVLKAPKDNSAEEKIRNLKATNKELALRYRQTKLALDKTMERLSIVTDQKEQVEKAVCRQLHRTHGILRAARKNLENPSEPTVPPLSDAL